MKGNEFWQLRMTGESVPPQRANGKPAGIDEDNYPVCSWCRFHSSSKVA